MTIPEIFLLALALSADAFSVGAAVGLDHRRPRQVFRLSFHFGLFQALMPLVGALAGSLLLTWVRQWDHWVVFGVLAALGSRMVYGAVASDSEQHANVDLTKGWKLVGLSIATSIDALAAGIGLAMSGAPIALSVTIIGLVAAAATAIAMLAAGTLLRGLGKKAEVAAGLVLILLGVKTLLEHLNVL